MRIVIAGAGLAAQRCAETLRANGHDGPITMVGAEPHAPYDRPPLSKAVLAGERPDLAFRLADVELITGTRVTRVTGSAHWEAAARQGAAAARAMLGLPKRADAPPVVWTDQYGVRIQRVGETRGAVAIGDLTYARDGRVAAVVLIDRPGDVARARREIKEAA